MEKKDLKSLFIAASYETDEVLNTQKQCNSIVEFENEVINDFVESLSDSGFTKTEFELDDCILNINIENVVVKIDGKLHFIPEEMVVEIDGKLHFIPENDAVIIQAIWNNNLNQIADELSDKLGYTVSVLSSEYEDIQQFYWIAEGLSSSDEVSVLNTIGILFRKFTEIEQFDDNTFITECKQYADCLCKALLWLKTNNKCFDAMGHYIETIARDVENENVFIVLTDRREDVE